MKILNYKILLFILYIILQIYFISTIFAHAENRNYSGIALISCFCLQALIALLFFANKFQLNITKIFIIMIAVIGMLYTIIVPPGAGYDENSHFYNSYILANKFQNIDTTGYEIYIREADRNLEHFNPSSQDNKLNQVIYGKYIYSDGFFLDRNMQDLYVLITPSFVITSRYWLSHLPTALGLYLALVIGLEPIYLFIAGRLVQLLIFCLGAYYAVKKIPVGKECLMAILLLPITILQGSTYSEDPLLVAAGSVIIALSLKWTLIKDNNKKKIIGEGIIYLISCFIIIMIKYGVYIPLCFLPVILMNRKKIAAFLKSKKFVIPIAISAVLLAIAGLLGKSDIIYRAITDNELARGGMAYTLSYLIGHPLEIVALATNTLFEELDFVLGMLFSSFFTQGYIQIPNWEAVGFLFLVIWGMLIAHGENTILSDMQKKKMLAVFIMTSLILSVSFLFVYTRLTQNYILGLQGRYFLPHLVLLTIAMPLKNLKLVAINKYIWLGAFAFWHQIFIYTFLINIK